MSTSGRRRKHSFLSNGLILGYFLISLVSAVYFLSYFDCDVNIWDEGIPLSGASRMLEGQRPIRDFISYPPGRYFLYLFAFKMFGVNSTGPKILLAITSGLFAGCIWLIARRSNSLLLSILAVAFYLLMPMHYYYRFFTMMLILMIFCLDFQIRGNTIRQMISAGVIAAIILWFRIFMGHFLLVLLPGICLYRYFHQSKSKRIRLLIPSIVLLFAYIVLVIYSGGWTRWTYYLRLCSSFSRAGLSDMSLKWPSLWSISYVKGSSCSGLFQDCLFYVAAGVVISSIVFLVKNWKTQIELNLALIITTIFGFGLVVWRTGFGNLIRISPVIVLTAILLISNRRKSKWMWTVFLGTMFIGIVIDSLIVNPFVYQSVGIRTHCTSKLSHPRLSAKVLPNECRDISYLASLLETLGDSSDTTMLVLPFHTLYNYISQYHCPAYFDWLLPANFRDAELRRAMVSNILESTPDIVLLDDNGFDGIPERAFSIQYPELMLWFMCDYFRWAQYEEYEIFRRKPAMKESLLRNPNALVVVSGIAKVADISIEDSSFPTLELVGNGEWRVQIDKLSWNTLAFSLIASRFKMQADNLEVSVMINEEEVFWSELTQTQSRDSVFIPLNEYFGDSVSVAISVNWFDVHPENRVVFLDPAVFNVGNTFMIVDRWCATL